MKRPVKTLALEMPENYNTILPDWINESTSEGGAFQELLTSTEAPVLPVERFTGQWLRIQQAQLALKTAAGEQVASGGPSSLSRLLKRARAELAGYKSAFYRICIGSSAASDHMLLICSATFPRVEGGKKHKRGTEYLAEDATIEVSDGWYFIKAHLDAELSHHLRCGRLRAGQYLHVCGAKATELTEDPLNLGPSARLHLSHWGVARVARGARRRPLGFQKAFSFPPTKIEALPSGFALIPSVDVVALRVTTATVSMCGHFREQEDFLKNSIEVIAMDSQLLSQPLNSWWTAIVKIVLLGDVATDLHALDRLLITSLRNLVQPCALKEVVSTRNTSLQRCPGSDGQPAGIKMNESSWQVLESSFCRGPPLFSAGGSVPAPHFQGYMCDLIGVPVSSAEPSSFFLLAPGQKLCCINLDCLPNADVSPMTLLSAWNELAEKALSASHLGKAPDAVAVQNLTYLGDKEIVSFMATPKQIQVSLAPEDVRMQQAMDFCFFSPAELQQAHFVCTSISCKGLADA